MDYYSLFRGPLAQRHAEGRPIRVGVIGTGKFGAGLVAQISQMRGMVVAAIADVKLDHARHAYASSGAPVPAQRTAEGARDIDEAIRAGHPVVAEEGALLAQADQIDVVVEATGVPEVGARMAFGAIQRRKHVVMVNVEADVTVGPILRRMAES